MPSNNNNHHVIENPNYWDMYDALGWRSTQLAEGVTSDANGSLCSVLNWMERKLGSQSLANEVYCEVSQDYELLEKCRGELHG